MTFKKHCLIRHNDCLWQSVCVDDELAVFVYAGKKLRSKDNRLNFTKMFAVSQTVLDGFEYELVLEGR